ncbi:MAG: SGNH/GDSL hydrolase family protein [Lentisphaeria bacterium]|nr:SGNH/GDSL hydrolase family protein [Lentisphaeria bacterium]
MIKTVLFQGDSITDARRDREAVEGNTSSTGTGYVALVAGKLLAQNIGKEFNCINRGISGNRVVDLYARWKVDALNLKPDLLSILVGVNDTWHEFAWQNGVEVERYEQIYRMLLEWTKAELPNVKLVLCEPFCLLSELVTQEWVAEVRQRGEVVKKLAAEFDATFVPLQQLLEDAAAKAGDNLKILRDGVHPTLLGAQIIADQWLKIVDL